MFFKAEFLVEYKQILYLKPIIRYNIFLFYISIFIFNKLIQSLSINNSYLSIIIRNINVISNKSNQFKSFIKINFYLYINSNIAFLFYINYIISLLHWLQIVLVALICSLKV